jgi:hypothetical protein
MVDVAIASSQSSSSSFGDLGSSFQCALEDEAEYSPLRDDWPATSMLSRDHFTIDVQTCLHCGKRLGYAMPMNKRPKIQYLFCDLCPKSISFIRCHVCGNFNNETSGTVVHRPGNSGYSGPSQIYSFMCYHCLKDQKEQEPGVEETREMMKLVRETRRKKELEERGELALTGAEGFQSELPTAPESVVSRKRVRISSPKLAQKEEAMEDN